MASNQPRPLRRRGTAGVGGTQGAVIAHPALARDAHSGRLRQREGAVMFWVWKD